MLMTPSITSPKCSDFPDGSNRAIIASYTRDFRGNPLTMTDGNNHTTTYKYDLAGNLIKTTFAEAPGTFTTRTYDELNRRRVRDRRTRRPHPHDERTSTKQAAAAPTGSPS